MFVFRVCMDLAETLGLNFHSPNGGQRFDERDLDDPSKWTGKSGVFGPVRQYCAWPFLDTAKVVLHLRDPRDALTSMYYSVAYSHPSDRRVDGIRDHTKSISIDEFAFSPLIDGKTPADFYLNRFQEYCANVVDRKGVAFVKYEDMLLDLEAWLRAVLRPVGLDKDSKTVASLMQRYSDEFKIEKEDQMAHKRQIAPGDHRRKLQPATIDRLNAMYEPILKKLQYPL